MNRPQLVRGVLAGIFFCATAPGWALSGAGDSAPGSIDTVAPVPGTATIPANGGMSGETISYSGASDASGIASVVLWVRKDGDPWGSSGLSDTGTSGSFSFVPVSTGLYHFDLVAEDSLGNRSTAPSGSTGTGQGSTLFSTNIPDWSLIDS